MSSIYLRNLAGQRLTDFELLSISRPRLELSIHITMKMGQAGALAGALLGPAATLLGAWREGKLSGDEHCQETCDEMKRAGARAGVTGACVGLLLGPLCSWAYARGKTDVEVFDRCYRLRLNTKQVRVDRASIVGAAAGGAVVGAGGLVVGLNVGLIGASLYNAVFG